MPAKKKVTEEIKEEAKKVSTRAKKVVADVKAEEKKAEKAVKAAPAKAKATAKKVVADVKAEEKKVEKAVKKPVAKATAAKLNIQIQSPIGGVITPEEIAAKVPKEAVDAYVRVDENKIYWVGKKGVGSVDIWE